MHHADIMGGLESLCVRQGMKGCDQILAQNAGVRMFTWQGVRAEMIPEKKDSL